MSTEIDLNRSTGLVTLGVHTFQIARFEEVMGSSGYPYWRYSCKCVDQSGDDRGKECLLMISLSPQARFRVDEFLDAMKAPSKGKTQGENFVGKYFRADVTHEEYEGRPQTRLNNLVAYDGQLAMELGGEEPLPEEGEEPEKVARPARSDPF